MLLGAAVPALALLGLARADPVFPFTWDTAGSRLYSFCSNASGPLSPATVSALARSKIMVSEAPPPRISPHALHRPAPCTARRRPVTAVPVRPQQRHPA